MRWSYQCPRCRGARTVDWSARDALAQCGACGVSDFVPTPATHHEAYVDTRTWPMEMESVVLELKGDMCTVPQCTKAADTLDHRIAWANGGRTSVENLFPMCDDHNLSKCDKDYAEWLMELRIKRITQLFLRKR